MTDRLSPRVVLTGLVVGGLLVVFGGGESESAGPRYLSPPSGQAFAEHVTQTEPVFDRGDLQVLAVFDSAHRAQSAEVTVPSPGTVHVRIDCASGVAVGRVAATQLTLVELTGERPQGGPPVFRAGEIGCTDSGYTSASQAHVQPGPLRIQVETNRLPAYTAAVLFTPGT
ncbi:MAG: hypothetical protein Q4G51_17785 [Dermatophilus congolensis]|nr:hypothetical protein [Dermatophilus congolensis]